MPSDSLKLPSHYTPEPELREQLSNRPGEQRCVEGDQELLLILHEIPKPGVPETILLFWRRHDGRWVQPGGSGINELDELLGRYLDVIDSRQETVTKAGNAAEVFAVIRQAAPLARSLSELAKALEKSLSFDPEDRAIRSCRDRARTITRAAELLHADARSTLDFIRAEQGEKSLAALDRMTRTLNRVSVSVVLFLPLVAFGAVLSIDPGIAWPLRLSGWFAFLAAAGTAWVLLTKKR